VGGFLFSPLDRSPTIDSDAGIQMPEEEVGRRCDGRLPVYGNDGPPGIEEDSEEREVVVEEDPV